MTRHPKFTLTEPEYRALRLKAEEAKRLRRAMLKVRSIVQCPMVSAWLEAKPVIDRALARRKR